MNEAAAAKGTVEALEEVKAGLIDGSVHAYDVSAFTVDGKELDTFAPGEATDPTFDPETKLVYDGYLHESEYRSAPYFDATIDGITLLDQQF